MSAESEYTKFLHEQWLAERQPDRKSESETRLAAARKRLAAKRAAKAKAFAERERREIAEALAVAEERLAIVAAADGTGREGDRGDDGREGDRSLTPNEVEQRETFARNHVAVAEHEAVRAGSIPDAIADYEDVVETVTVEAERMASLGVTVDRKTLRAMAAAVMHRRRSK